AFVVFLTCIKEFTRSTCNRPAISGSFNKILLYLWADQKRSRPSMSDHRVVTQYRLLFLEHVISCHSPQPNYSRRADKYFCVAFGEGFGFEQFLKHGTGTLPTNCFDIIQRLSRQSNPAVTQSTDPIGHR